MKLCDTFVVEKYSKWQLQQPLLLLVVFTDIMYT